MPPALALNRYDAKQPLEWMQTLRDYMAGRTEEIDSLLNWVELRTEPIVVEELTAGDSVPRVDRAPSLNEVSRQL